MMVSSIVMLKRPTDASRTGSPPPTGDEGHSTSSFNSLGSIGNLSAILVGLPADIRGTHRRPCSRVSLRTEPRLLGTKLTVESRYHPIGTLCQLLLTLAGLVLPIRR